MRCSGDAVCPIVPKRTAWIAMAGGLVVALAVFSTAQAQLLNPFRGFRGPMMNDRDKSLAREALQTLLNQDQAMVGKTETWSNPADRRHGSLTIAGSFHRDGMDCRTIHSSVSFPERTSPRNFTLRVCRTPRGEWKML